MSSDCGFGREGMSRRIAFYKMVSIVRGANIVRRELGLPEARASPPIRVMRSPKRYDGSPRDGLKTVPYADGSSA